HCQSWDREISAVAASSMRLWIAAAPVPPSHASRYCRPTSMLVRTPSRVMRPSGMRTSSSCSARIFTSGTRDFWCGTSFRTESNTSVATGTRSGCATQVPSKPSPDSRSLSSRTFESATRFTSGSFRDGMNAAMPPIACAPRRWHVATSSSVYARMNGTASVQRAAVVAQLVQDLLHLERGEGRLDQHGAADRAVRDAELLLRERERLRPQPRLEVRLQLGQVEVRPAAAVEQLARVAGERQPEVEERRRDGLAVDEHVALGQMPAARPDHE